MRKRDTMTHLFRGRRYSIENGRQRKMRGSCDEPSTAEKVINIPSEGSSRDNLSTIIHESLHACLWDIAEESVEETGESVAHLLWRLGWRKTRVVGDKRC